MRLVHFADLHLGAGKFLPTRDPSTHLTPIETDALVALDKLCDYVENNSIDAVLFAGDAFHTLNPRLFLQQQLAARFARIRNSGSLVIGILGNHDLPQSSAMGHAFGVYRALGVEGVTMTDQSELMCVKTRSGDLQVATLPHYSVAKFRAGLGNLSEKEAETILDNSIADQVKNLSSQVNDSIPAVFLGHCHIRSASTINMPLQLSDLTLNLSALTQNKKFSYYALGHIHEYQELRSSVPVVYSGSLNTIDFGEGDRFTFRKEQLTHKPAKPKGFVRVDLSDGSAECEFIEMFSRKFISLRVDRDKTDATDRATAAVQALLEKIDIRDACVSIKVGVDVRGDLNRSMVMGLVDSAAGVRIYEDPDEQQQVIRDQRFAHGRTDEEYFLDYCETLTPQPKQFEEFKQAARALMSE